MAIVSFINLKGGVGKTTCCVAMAEFLAGYHHRRVLVVDLDPQTNASITLVGDERWERADARGQTIRQMFLDEFVPRQQRLFTIADEFVPRQQRAFTIADCFLPHASNVEECQPNLWLLPSSLGLIGLEAVVEMVRSASQYTVEPFEVLSRHLTPEVVHLFDDVLIDCPPSLNSVTLNGVFVSDAYIIPTLPEPVSTLGIVQILDRIARLGRIFGRTVPALGILINRYDTTTHMHKYHEQTRAQLAATPGYPALFATVIPERQKAMLAMRYETGARTLAGKYHDSGTPATDEAWPDLSAEYLARCADLPARG